MEAGKLSDVSRINCFASKSKSGKDYTGAKKVNQDSYLLKTSVFGLEDYCVFGVYDGHGMHGHFTSQSAKFTLGNYFSNIEHFLGDMKQGNNLSSELIAKRLLSDDGRLLKNAYFEAEAVMQKDKFDCNFSGTTAVTIILLGDSIISLNAGDSRGILVNDSRSKV